MPHKTCSVCVHKDLEAINVALRTGSPTLRALADRHAVSKTSLLRHKRHLDPSPNRVNTAEIDVIDRQIARLERAQRRAQRARTRDVMVNITRELRSWITLRAKVQSAMLPETSVSEPAVSPREALVMAETIVEMNLAGEQRQQVLEWLNELAERLRPPDAMPAEQSSRADGSVETLENGDISGTAEIEHV
jgi:hypothetical protein